MTALWQKNNSGLCAQRRLRSDWADAQADESSLGTQATSLVLSLGGSNMKNLKTQRQIASVLFYHMSLITRKPVFGVYDQVRLKPTCAATEAS